MKKKHVAVSVEIFVQSVELIIFVRVSRKSAGSSMSCCFASNSAARLVSNENVDSITSLIKQIKSCKFVSLSKPDMRIIWFGSGSVFFHSIRFLTKMFRF